MRNILSKKGFWFVLAFVFFDLMFAGASYQPTLHVSKESVEPAMIKEIKKDQSIFRVAALGDLMIPNSSSVFGLQDVRGMDIVPSLYRNFFHGFKGAFQIGLYFLNTEVNHDFLDLLNVKYLAVNKNYFFDQSGFEKKGDFGQVGLWENKKVWPRAFITTQPLGAGDGVELGKAEITSYTADEVLIKVDVFDHKSLLVLADSYDSGWQVWVDGQRAQMLKVYDILRGVELGKGSHLVRFVYQPWSVVWGIRVSVISVLIFSLSIVLLLWRFFKQRSAQLRPERSSC